MEQGDHEKKWFLDSVAGFVGGVGNYRFKADDEDSSRYLATATLVDNHIVLETQVPGLGTRSELRGIEDLNDEGRANADRRLYDLVLEWKRKNFPSVDFDDRTSYAKSD